ncbi:MAG: folate-binding protein YgfZ [Polyangiaceae bacterium]
MTTLLLLDTQDLGTLQITGADRLTWLNGLVTCEVKTLKPGQGSYGLALSKVGKILADIRIVVEAERILLGVGLDVIQSLREAMDRYLIMEDCELSDVSSAWSWLELHGESAAAVANAAAEKLGGVSTSIDRSGLGGAVLVVAKEKHSQALTEIESATGKKPAAADEWTAFRVKHKVPERGHDFDDKTYPQEASLEQKAVSFSKGCYLGQEVVCMLQMRGKTQRKVVGIAASAGGELKVGAQVLDERGEQVGSVTTVSNDDGTWRGLAMVKTTALTGGALSVNGLSVSLV